MTSSPEASPQPATDPPEAGRTPAAPPATPDRAQLDGLGLRLVPVASGLAQPIHVTHAGDGGGRLFVVERAGRIRIVADGQVAPEPFLDITPLVGSGGSEQGLLSVAFHPEYARNARFFVHYTDRLGDTVIAEYGVGADPGRADPGSARVLLTVDQPYANHNGGLNLFAPDGYLY
ncbi:MAG TPA: PQQ-dependent sugar dehydrogenase, partial [Dehalococcoidia bacterium]|nr:PQQ-dependent sugar dehydrogenase [Dehalococcoidia bacterium]